MTISGRASVYLFTLDRFQAVAEEGSAHSFPFERIITIDSRRAEQDVSLEITTADGMNRFQLPWPAGDDFAAKLLKSFESFRASKPLNVPARPLRVEARRAAPALAASAPSVAPANEALFGVEQARAGLAHAAEQAQSCGEKIGVSSEHSIVVTFAPDGHVSGARFGDENFNSVPGSSCVRSCFRRVSVPAFTGGAVTMTATFRME